MKQTAVQQLEEYLTISLGKDRMRMLVNEFEQAKAMEKKEKLKHQLFIGKVTEILGFDKTVELLKQCNDEII